MTLALSSCDAQRAPKVQPRYIWAVFPPPVEHIFPLGVHISKRDAEEQRALDLVEGCGDGFESCLYPSLISHLTSGSL